MSNIYSIAIGEVSEFGTAGNQKSFSGDSSIYHLP